MVDEAPKIFLVDDDPLMSRMYYRKLTTEGFDVAVAKDGEESMTKIKSGYRPDLVLLDIMMPNMNGFQFLEEFKTVPEHEKTPVLIITNLSDFEGKNKDRALSLGAKDYLVKAQISLDDLVGKVREALGAEK